MRLELRSSSGDVCTACGSHDLLLEAGSGDELARDLGPLIQGAAEELANHLVGRDRDLVIAKVRALDPPPARRIRPFKRRWRARLHERVEAVVDELLDRTRFV